MSNAHSAGSPAVLFDLDGTLVDTAYLHTLAWWRALDDAGHRVPMAVIHPLIGMGSGELLGTLLGRNESKLSDAHGRYFAQMHPLVRPLPGAPALIAKVKGAGFRNVIVTSAKPGDLPALLGALDADDHIDELVHGEETSEAKPAPDIFETALARIGLSPDHAVAVGDSVWDVQAANRIGMACVGVQSGGNDAARLLGAGAVEVYEDCADLAAHWDTSALAALCQPAAGQS